VADYWKYNTGTPEWGPSVASGARLSRARTPGSSASEGSDLSEKKRKRLLNRKKRIEALLPVVDEDRRKRMARKLDQINAQLGVEESTVQQWIDRGNVAGTQGVGSEEFQVQAPPGIGRLVRIPFYMLTLPIGYAPAVPLPRVTTAAGPFLPSAFNPLIILGVANGTQFAPPIRLTTPVLAWAECRVVGFEVTTREQSLLAAPNAAGGGASSRPWILAKDLHVDGSANLFPQHDWMDTAAFNSVTPEFAGLRAYPLLERTKSAFVDITATFSTFPAGAAIALAPSITFSCSLIAEVLSDEQYGQHLAGAYARGAALERLPHTDGTLQVGTT
tara:strand:- start:14707 stop:15699 length:993 start_codon:yes stop_codon:yes gene_type:complete